MQKSSAIIFLLATLAAFAQPPEFNADSAFAYLEQQCAFGPRNPGSDGYYRCLQWFQERLENLTPEVYLQPFKAVEALTGETRKLTNVIARFDGGDAPALILCAHWDTRVYANLDPDPAMRETPIIGANDGASGVAVLLEIARIAAGNPPPRPLLIIFFDGEDMGRATHAEEFALGSRYWAKNPIPELPPEAILLDMIGDADLEIAIEYFSERNAPGLRGYLWELAARLGLEAFRDEPGPAVEDDHVPLQKVGVEAIDLIDFDYPYWHTIEDTPDKCSPESLDQVGRLLIAFIYGLE